MFSNVVVGVDGRQGGRDAIALAQQLATADARLTLAHVYVELLGRGATMAPAMQRRDATELLESERARASVDAELATCGELAVGRGLHELAEERHADLLVVGSTRHALLGRVLMGDDCRAALDGAPCAMAIAPRGYALAQHRLHRLGVGYDATPASEDALSVARELATAHGSVLRAMWVVSIQQVQEDKPIPADWPQAIAELLESHADRLAQLDSVDGIASYGGPREDLTHFSKSLDLLIVGSRGFGPAGRLFHGSVSRHLARHAACPLLVLPHPDAGAVRFASAGRAVAA